MSQQMELFSSTPFCVKLTIEESCRIFRETYWNNLPSGKNTNSHFHHICEFFRNRHIDSISNIDIQDFRSYLKKLNLKDSTINRIHSTLSRVFSRLGEYKQAGEYAGIDFSKVILPAKNPCFGVHRVSEIPFSRRVVVSPEEFKILKQYADEDLKDILNMLVWTRLRPSDLRRFTDKNINWHTRQLEGVQHKTITTRNPSGVQYDVPLSPRMIELLKRRMEVVKPGSPLLNFSNLQKRYERARKLSGLLFVQLRDLRRSAASYLHDNGEPLVTVSKGLGHQSTRMTERYLPRTHQHLSSSVNILSEVF